jgi:hypothetical protein
MRPSCLVVGLLLSAQQCGSYATTAARRLAPASGYARAYTLVARAALRRSAAALAAAPRRVASSPASASLRAGAARGGGGGGGDVVGKNNAERAESQARAEAGRDAKAAEKKAIDAFAEFDSARLVVRAGHGGDGRVARKPDAQVRAAGRAASRMGTETLTGGAAGGQAAAADGAHLTRPCAGERAALGSRHALASPWLRSHALARSLASEWRARPP